MRRTRQRILGIDVDHGTAGRLENDLRAGGVQVLGTAYGPGHATLKVALGDEADILAAFTDRLATLSAGSCTARALGTEWVDAP